MKSIILLTVSSLLFLAVGCKKEAANPSNPDSPKACFTVPSAGGVNESIPFSAECSQNATNYRWDFGDGSHSSLKNPSHLYNSSGTYTVQLKVFGTDSTKSSAISTSINILQATVRYLSGEIHTDSTLTSGTYIVLGTVTVTHATLTINPGVTLYMSQLSSIDIGIDVNDPASLQANGTSSAPITITAAGNNQTNGYWNSIIFHSDALSSSMAYCDIAYGGGEYYADGELDIMGSKVSIKNCNLHHSSKYGIRLEGTGTGITIENNTITQCDMNPIYVAPNSVHLIGLTNVFDNQSKIVIANEDFSLNAASWKKQSVPYRLENELFIRSATGSVLTLEPGVEIQMGNNASIFVGFDSTSLGSLVAIGTATEPVKFTSYNTSPAAGDWEGIGIYGSQTSPTILKYCVLEYGGYSGINRDFDPHGVLDIRNCGATIENCVFSNYNTCAINLNGAGRFDSFINNTLNAPQKTGIIMFPNWVHTIGGNNTFNVNPDRAVVVNGGILSQSSVTWRKLPVAYNLAGNIDIGSAAGSTLTIAPGCILKINGGHFIRTGNGYRGPGALIADGSSDTIRFTNGMNDALTGPGTWAYIYLDYYTMPGTLINHCIIENGGSESFYGMIHVNYNNNAVITNNIIRNSLHYGISLSASSPTMAGNVFSNNADGESYITY